MRKFWVFLGNFFVNSLGILWRFMVWEFFENSVKILCDFFVKSLRIICEFLEKFLGNSLGILREFFGNYRGILWGRMVGGF